MLFKIFIKELKYKIKFAISFFIVFTALYFLSRGYVAMNEIVFIVFSLIVSATIWKSEDECDMILLTQAGLTDVMLARFFAMYLSLALFPSVIIILFAEKGDSIHALLVFTVTILFVCAIGTLVRTIIDNTMASLIFSLTAFMAMIFPGNAILSKGISWYPFWSFSLEDAACFLQNRALTAVYSAIFILLAFLILRYKERKTVRKTKLIRSDYP